jgi:hypothetical protein
LIHQLIFAQAHFQQAGRQRRSIQRHAAQLFHNIATRADMIFVAVCVQDAVYLQVAAFEDVANVWDDVIHAKHIRSREHDARIDDDRIFAIFKDGHILADFAKPTQGDDAQARCAAAAGFLLGRVLVHAVDNRRLIGRQQRIFVVGLARAAACGVAHAR